MRPHRTLTRTRDFDLVRREGRRVRGPGMSLYIRKSEVADAPTRVGLAAPRGGGGAVVRNRIKRRLRAAAARALPRRGWDVLITGRPELVSMSFHKVVGGLQEAVTSSPQSVP